MMAWLVACLAGAPGARATIFDEIAVADGYIDGGAVQSSFVMILQESPLRVPIMEFSLAAISTPVTGNSATLLRTHCRRSSCSRLSSGSCSRPSSNAKSAPTFSASAERPPRSRLTIR